MVLSWSRIEDSLMTGVSILQSQAALESLQGMLTIFLKYKIWPIGSVLRLFMRIMSLYMI